jgi:fumarate hydratase class II
VPYIGYDDAALIAKEAQHTGKTIMEIAKLKTDISEYDLDRILDPMSMTVRGSTSGPSGG